MTDARDLTLALGGRWSGATGMARCPTHDDRTPSLSIRDGEQDVILTCFAGCDRRDIVAELRRRGLFEGRADKLFRKPVHREPEHKPDSRALEIWRDGKPSADSIVERYLRLRGIALPLPPSVRFGARPTMIAAVQAPAGAVIAVQQTLLTPEARRAAIAVPRITTGALGYGAVRLAKAIDVLGLAEGVESAFSAMQLSGLPCWASLGATRMQRVAIPSSVRELHIFGDNDDAGRTAAEQTAAANKGRRIVLRFPSDGFKDWNDVLTKVGATA